MQWSLRRMLVIIFWVALILAVHLMTSFPHWPTLGAMFAGDGERIENILRGSDQITAVITFMVAVGVGVTGACLAIILIAVVAIAVLFVLPWKWSKSEREETCSPSQ